MKLNLRKLESQDEEAFLAAYREFNESDDFDFVSFYQEGMNFDAFWEELKAREMGINLQEGHVPATYLFGFVGSKIVGRVMIRHQLNDFLKTIGGHVGYGVVPSERGKGFATEMFRRSFPIARSLGLEKVLVTCDEDNIPSRKIIENMGGILDGFTEQGQGLPRKRRYWISLTS